MIEFYSLLFKRINYKEDDGGETYHWINSEIKKLSDMGHQYALYQLACDEFEKLTFDEKLENIIRKEEYGQLDNQFAIQPHVRKNMMIIILRAALESLEVNPSINGYMIGEVLYRSEMCTELGLSEAENKELAYKWFIFSASYNNEKALFKLSKMYLDELVLEILDNGGHTDMNLISQLNRPNIYYDDNSSEFLIDRIKKFFSQKKKYNMSQENTLTHLQNIQDTLPTFARCN